MSPLRALAIASAITATVALLAVGTVAVCEHYAESTPVSTTSYVDKRVYGCCGGGRASEHKPVPELRGGGAVRLGAPPVSVTPVAAPPVSPAAQGTVSAAPLDGHVPAQPGDSPAICSEDVIQPSQETDTGGLPATEWTRAPVPPVSWQSLPKAPPGLYQPTNEVRPAPKPQSVPEPPGALLLLAGVFASLAVARVGR